MPPGAWDTHCHVLGPQARFPYAAGRRYTPPDAPLDACLRLHDRLGIARGFIVHANTHGLDNGVFLDAVARAGGRYLGVLRLTTEATAQGCRHLHEQGIRGVRFAFNPQHGGRLDRDEVEHVARCVADLGWFVDLHLEGRALPELADWLKRLPTRIVLDHLGRVDLDGDDAAAQFHALLGLAEREHVWVKLSGIDRLSRLGLPYRDVAPIAAALLRTAPHRVVWGSDWPHTGYFRAEQVPDDADLVDALAVLVPDADLRRRILVDNPLRLVGA